MSMLAASLPGKSIKSPAVPWWAAAWSLMLAVLTFFAWGPPAHADDATTSRTGLVRPILSPELTKRLDQTVTADLVEMPLKETLAFLIRQTQLEIDVDQKSVESLNLGLQTPVTFRSRNLPIQLVLDRILSPLGLTWAPWGRGVIVQSRDRHETSVYRVRGLLAPIERHSLNDADELAQAIRGYVSSPRGGLSGGTTSITPDGSLVVTARWRTRQAVAEIVAGLEQSRLAANPTSPIMIHSRQRSRRLDSRPRLDKQVTCDFTETPLSDALANLGAQGSTEIRLTLREIELGGLAATTPVTLRKINAPLGEVLRQLLAPLELVALLDEEGLQVASAKSAAATVDWTIYRVADLCEGKDKKQDAFRYAELVRRIVAHTGAGNKAARTDEFAGNASASPVMSAGALLITASDAVHDEVEQLLSDLRATRKHELSEVHDAYTVRAYRIRLTEGVETTAQQEENLCQWVRQAVPDPQWRRPPFVVGDLLMVEQTPRGHFLVERQLKPLKVVLTPIE